MKHPFNPLIFKSTRKLLIGTLPPEGVDFYFSNSSNTRLWDILQAIYLGNDVVGRGGNLLSKKEKNAVVEGLGIGISDIIYEYQREVESSTQDAHIIPVEYKNLLELAVEHGIKEFLFVYSSAYKWFLHSLTGNVPVVLRSLRGANKVGELEVFLYKGLSIKCVLVPSPLNRGRKGETMLSKLEVYRRYILG